MSSLMHQGRATYAFFERNWNLSKRYWGWEIVWLVYNIVNAMSVTYIGASAQLITGIKINTSPTDFAPIKQIQMARFEGERWKLFGSVLSGEISG